MRLGLVEIMAWVEILKETQNTGLARCSEMFSSAKDALPEPQKLVEFHKDFQAKAKSVSTHLALWASNYSVYARGTSFLVVMVPSVSYSYFLLFGDLCDFVLPLWIVVQYVDFKKTKWESGFAVADLCILLQSTIFQNTNVMKVIKLQCVCAFSK